MSGWVRFWCLSCERRNRYPYTSNTVKPAPAHQNRRTDLIRINPVGGIFNKTRPRSESEGNQKLANLIHAAKRGMEGRETKMQQRFSAIDTHQNQRLGSVPAPPLRLLAVCSSCYFVNTPIEPAGFTLSLRMQPMQRGFITTLPCFTHQLTQYIAVQPMHRRRRLFDFLSLESNPCCSL